MPSDLPRRTRRFVYLSGAIDRAPDQGRGWRAKVAAALRAIGAQPYDPAEEQQKVCGLDVKGLRELRDTDLEMFKEKTRLVVAADLRVVAHESLAVVAHVSAHARMGTYAEMGIAAYRTVPLFVILDHPEYQASGWSISTAERIFPTTQHFVSWLDEGRRAGKTVEEILSARS